MHVTASDSHFSAILKDTTGKVLAEGYASVSRESHSVEFNSDFVPLYPIGTCLIIERIYGEKPIHRFAGEVYISDKQLLRLVAVHDQLLPGSEKVYFTDTALAAKLTEDEPDEDIQRKGPLNKLAGVFRKKTPPVLPQAHEIVISAITAKSFEFNSPHMFEMGKRYLLTMDPPVPMENIPIRISKVYAFNKDVGHLCSFEEMDPAIREGLAEFIKALNVSKNQFFPS